MLTYEEIGQVILDALKGLDQELNFDDVKKSLEEAYDLARTELVLRKG